MDTPKKEFELLIGKLEKCLKEKDEKIAVLKAKNRDLENKLRTIHSGQTDIYTAITEKKRIALKQEIQEFIEKIEQHLNQVEHQDN